MAARSFHSIRGDTPRISSIRTPPIRRLPSHVLPFHAEDFEIERRIGSVGYLEYVATTTDPTRPSPPPTPTPGAVQARLYQAVIRAGELSGTRVILKAYPIGVEADLLASNELRAFASLQPPSTPDYSSHLTKLLGAFQVGPPGATESWLVLRNDGLSTVDQFAVQCAKAFGEGRAVGEAQFWDRFDSTAPLRRRADIIRRILTGVLLGLEAMHDRDWLHQSLGPASVSLDTTDESRMGRFLNVRLRDLAFAVDVSKKTFVGGNTLADIWQGSGAERKPDPRDKLAEPLFVRARQEGAESPDDRRDFGKADDIFAAGLLFIYLALTPFARSDDVDMGQLQRLVEGAFRADLEGFREYCEADDRWEAGCAFLNERDSAGWKLVTSMLDRDWRQRPTVRECLTDTFLTPEK